MGFPASSAGGGMCFAFPDVCNTPSPAGPVPIPYPNTAQCPMAVGTATTVKIGNMPAITDNSSIPLSNGDEAGVAGGVVSGVNMSKCAFKLGSFIVKIEDHAAIRLLDMTGQNGSSPNAVGAVVSPSQATVLVG